MERFDFEATGEATGEEAKCCTKGEEGATGWGELGAGLKNSTKRM